MDEKTIPRFELNTNTTLGYGASSTTYISPSDAIRSPTTKKLSEIKGKRFQYVFISPLRFSPNSSPLLFYTLLLLLFFWVYLSKEAKKASLD